jgi:hypothetical protein
MPGQLQRKSGNPVSRWTPHLQGYCLQEYYLTVSRSGQKGSGREAGAGFFGKLALANGADLNISRFITAVN